MFKFIAIAFVSGLVAVKTAMIKRGTHSSTSTTASTTHTGSNRFLGGSRDSNPYLGGNYLGGNYLGGNYLGGDYLGADYLGADYLGAYPYTYDLSYVDPVTTVSTIETVPTVSTVASVPTVSTVNSQFQSVQSAPAQQSTVLQK